MKKRYFIPLSSLNLNGVFASESISPHSFYEKRMFGVPYNTLTDNNGIYLQTESSLALYPEYFEFIPTVGSAVFIGVYEDDLDLSALVNDIETGISYYFKTIYLRKGNFFVLFLGDDEKMLFLATAAPSTEVKTLNKYNKKHHFGNDRETDIFYSIPDFPKKAYNRNLANLLSNNKAVYFDKAFNHIKGFVYGYLCGALGQKNEDEIELENTFQELHNLITGIKGKIEITQLFSPNDFDEFKKELDKSSSLFMRLVPNEKNFNYENILLRLQELINLQEKRFAKLTRQKRHFDGIDRGEVKAIQKQIEELEKSFYSIRGKEQDLRDKKKWFEENKPKRTKANTSERIEKVRIDREIEDIKVNIKNLKPEKQDLQQQISYLRNDLQQPTAIGRTEFDNSVDEQYYRIAAYITDLSFSVSERINEKKKTLSWPKIDQLIFDIKKLTQHWAKIASNNFDFIISFNSTYIQQLSQFDLAIYKNCINVILAYAKTDSNNLNAKATDLAIYLLKEIKLCDNQNNDDTIKAVNNLTEFIEYRSNRLSDYKFPENSVLAAFICNIIKPNSIDEFTSLIQSNRIGNLEIAYSFWAAFNGFANLPKNLTDIVLENENEQLLKYIDSYLFLNYLRYN